MTRNLALFAALALMFDAASAQNCPQAGQVLLKNDILPAIPAGPTAVSVIQGLCDGESAAAVFNVQNIGSHVKVDLAAIAYINVANAGGVSAIVDLEIFDGVTFTGGIPTLGPSRFLWSQVTGTNIQLTSSGINTSPDLGAYNIVCTSGKIVCAWHMGMNLGGNCPSGYPTNYATDNSTVQPPFGGCSPLVTPPQKNLIYILGQGWRDASAAVVQGFPLCPIYYAGNWIIRICVEPVNTTPPAVLSIVGPPTVSPNAFVPFTFSSPTTPNTVYICGVACSNAPPIPFVPFGSVPLAADACFAYMIDDILETPGTAHNYCIGFYGTLNAAGGGNGVFQVPSLIPPGLNLPLYFAFVTVAGTISNGVQITVN